MKLFKQLLPLILLTMLVNSPISYAGIVVVVGQGSPIGKASSKDIKKVFLGKKKKIRGFPVLPVDQSEGSGARAEFYKKIVKKNESQLKAYWSKLIFTGKSHPPRDGGSDADIKKEVAANPKLIGYIDEASVDGSVKVINRPK